MAVSSPTKTKRRTLGEEVCTWIEAYCVIPDGPRIGEPFAIPEFWKRIIWEWYQLLPDPNGSIVRPDGTWRRRYSQGLIGIAKKNIKTSIGAALSLYELAGSEDPAALVLSVASTEEQGSNLLFGSAKTMAERSPMLRDALNIMRAEIQVPSQPRARLKNIASKAGSQDGQNARAIFCDELHEWTGTAGRQLFAVLEGALTSREDATLLAITTAGYDEDSICWDKYQYGKQVESGEVDDPRFYFRWLEAPSGGDYKDPTFYSIPNPLMGLTVNWSVIEDRIRRDPESVVRRYHGNQWVSGADIWIPAAVWDASEDRSLDLREDLPVHVGIDVGIRHDSSAVDVAQYQPDSKRTVTRSFGWENPYARDHSLHDTWVFNIEIIEQFCRDLKDQYPVAAGVVDDEIMPGPEFCYDPAFFERSAQMLLAEGLNMVEFPQTDSRMVPASQCLHDLVVETKLAHNGDEAERRHVLSAIADQKARGWRLSKPKGSLRKIDRCIAKAIAVYRATLAEPKEEPSVYETRGIAVL